jgi:predicted lipoprotein with Yx(FWY)xxD motif
MAVVGLLAAGCGDDDADTETGGAATTEASTGTSETTGGDVYDPGGGSTGDTSDVVAATVQVADNPDLGELLVGPDGRTLYLFEKDEGTTSACTGACASTWPALTASGEPSPGEGVDAAKLSTADGQAPGHVAYNGHLLYYFASDTEPGDVNGLGIPSWYPVDPAGNKIDAD